MNPNLTLLGILIDRSGSMASIQKDMEGGLVTLLREQEKVPGELRVSVAQFDDVYEVVHENKLSREIERIPIQPRGSTALLKSLLHFIDDIGRTLAATPEDQRPGKVIIAIVTDGQENASGAGYTRAMVSEKVRHQSDVYKWTFMYLGANQDAFAEAASYGIQFSANYQANTAGVTRGVKGMSAALTQTRTGQNIDVDGWNGSSGTSSTS